jgi:hypothetical protein
VQLAEAACPLFARQRAHSCESRVDARCAQRGVRVVRSRDWRAGRVVLRSQLRTPHTANPRVHACIHTYVHAHTHTHTHTRTRAHAHMLTQRFSEVFIGVFRRVQCSHKHARAHTHPRGRQGPGWRRPAGCSKRQRHAGAVRTCAAKVAISGTALQIVPFVTENAIVTQHTVHLCLDSGCAPSLHLQRQWRIVSVYPFPCLVRRPPPRHIKHVLTVRHSKSVSGSVHLPASRGLHRQGSPNGPGASIGPGLAAWRRGGEPAGGASSKHARSMLPAIFRYCGYVCCCSSVFADTKLALLAPIPCTLSTTVCSLVFAQSVHTQLQKSSWHCVDPIPWTHEAAHTFSVQDLRPQVWHGSRYSA